MRLLKNLFLLVFIFSFLAVSAQDNIPKHTIRIGTFVNPKPADFDAIRSLGFIYTDKQTDGYSSVMMGGYKSKSEARKIANQIKSKGFSNPSVSTLDIDGGQSVTVIQLALEKSTSKFNWEKYLQLDELYIFLNDNQAKVMTGIFPNVETAQAQVSTIRAMGFKGAFVRNVNSAMLHAIGSFEMWGEKRALIPLVFRDDDQRDPRTRPASTDIPEPFENPEDRIKTTKQTETEVAGTLTAKGGDVVKPKNTTFERSFSAKLPQIRGKEKRNSALELQKILKIEGVYNSSLDGYYGKGTKAAYDKAVASNRQIHKYRILSKYASEIRTEKELSLEAHAIQNLWEDPNAIDDLAASNDALAKAYRAYHIFVTEGVDDRVNNLMNAGIQQSFKGKKPTNMPRFDYNATYAYNDLNQLLLHVRYIHEISNQEIAVPCWLFQKHPGIAMQAFNLDANSNIKMDDCGGFWGWEEVSVLSAIATDLDSRKSFDQNEIGKSKAIMNKMFLAPDPLNTADIKALEAWHKKLWKGIDGWSFRDPLLEELGTALKISYFQNYVLFEDYFMDEGYSKNEAKGMALKTLKALVGYHLERFV